MNYQLKCCSWTNSKFRNHSIPGEGIIMIVIIIIIIIIITIIIVVIVLIAINIWHICEANSVQVIKVTVFEINTSDAVGFCKVQKYSEGCETLYLWIYNILKYWKIIVKLNNSCTERCTHLLLFYWLIYMIIFLKYQRARLQLSAFTKIVFIVSYIL